MKRFFLLLTLSTLSVGAGCATAVDDEPATARIPEAAAILEGLEPNVTVVGEPGWSLDERMAHYNVRAVSLAVIEDYEIVWAEAFGMADAEESIPATTETLFQAGSISKPVAAAAVLAAAQEGQLDLDAPINSILTSWTLREVFPPSCNWSIWILRFLCAFLEVNAGVLSGYREQPPTSMRCPPTGISPVR